MEHRHFGYWINKARGRARCYECGHQYKPKSNRDAETWLATAAVPHASIIGPAACGKTVAKTQTRKSAVIAGTLVGLSRTGTAISIRSSDDYEAPLNDSAGDE